MSNNGFRWGMAIKGEEKFHTTFDRDENGKFTVERPCHGKNNSVFIKRLRFVDESRYTFKKNSAGKMELLNRD